MWTQTETDRRRLVATGPMRKLLSCRDTTGGRLDAAQVPPSVFAAHHGEPEILHDDKTHDRAKRHSIVSPQDQLSGV